MVLGEKQWDCFSRSLAIRRIGNVYFLAQSGFARLLPYHNFPERSTHIERVDVCKKFRVQTSKRRTLDCTGVQQPQAPRYYRSIRLKFFLIKIATKALALIAFFITMGTAHGAEWSVGETVVGKATWYGKKHHGQLMANGKKFDMYNPYLVAHKTLPKGTLLLVRNVANGQELVVKVQDRGPHNKDPNVVLDLSYAGAKKLGFVRNGKASLKITVLKLG